MIPTKEHTEELVFIVDVDFIPFGEIIKLARKYPNYKLFQLAQEEYDYFVFAENVKDATAILNLYKDLEGWEGSFQADEEYAPYAQEEELIEIT